MTNFEANCIKFNNFVTFGIELVEFTLLNFVDLGTFGVPNSTKSSKNSIIRISLKLVIPNILYL